MITMVYITRFFILFVLLSHSVSCLGQVKRRIEKIGSDGAWLWFNNESVILQDNTCIIGCEDSLGNSQIILYQKKEDPLQPLNKGFHMSTWSERPRRYPSHNYPSLLSMDESNILALYHNSKHIMYCRLITLIGENSDKILELSAEYSNQLSSAINYSNLVYLGSEKRIYNFYSVYDNSPSLVMSDDFGFSWNKEIKFMCGSKSGTSPYMRVTDNGRNRVDIIYTDGHPRTEDHNNIYHIFFQNQSFFSSEGKKIGSLRKTQKMPLLPSDGTMVYNGNSKGPGWVWDIEYDNCENPLVVFISSFDGAEGKDLRYHYASWDPETKKWRTFEIAHAGEHLYLPENHFAGGIALDPENTSVVYISTNIDPITGQKVLNSRYHIFRGETNDSGENWKWERLSVDENVDHLRPIVPRGHQLKVCVIWMALTPGYSRSFNSTIWGIFEK